MLLFFNPGARLSTGIIFVYFNSCNIDIVVVISTCINVCISSWTSCS